MSARPVSASTRPASWIPEGRSRRYHHALATVNAGASAATGATVANRPLRMATSSSAVAMTSSDAGRDRLDPRSAVEADVGAGHRHDQEHREHGPDPAREHRPELGRVARVPVADEREPEPHAGRGREQQRGAAVGGVGRELVALHRDQAAGHDRERDPDQRTDGRVFPGGEPPHHRDHRADHRGHRRHQAGPADREALVEAAEGGDVEHTAERAEGVVAAGRVAARDDRDGHGAGKRAELRREQHDQRAGASGGEAAQEVTTSERRSDDQPQQQRHRVPTAGRRGTVHAGARRVVGSWPWRCSS